MDLFGDYILPHFKFSVNRKFYFRAPARQDTPEYKKIRTFVVMTGPDRAFDGDSYENRTRVSAVRGRRLSRLTKEPFFRRFDIIPLSNAPVNSFFEKKRQTSEKSFISGNQAFPAAAPQFKIRRKHGQVSRRRPSPQLPFIDENPERNRPYYEPSLSGSHAVRPRRSHRFQADALGIKD